MAQAAYLWSRFSAHFQHVVLKEVMMTIEQHDNTVNYSQSRKINS